MLKLNSHSRVRFFGNQLGMTMIEIMIVVAIIGSMMALGASLLFPGNDAKMQEQSSKLASMIRYIYNEAAIKNKYFRIVFDIDQNTYKVESSTEPFLLAVNDEEALKKKSSASGAEPPEATGAPAFSAEEGPLVVQGKFPAGIKIKDISVLHLKDRVDQGQVEMYFFPSGWAEKMVLNMTDEDEENFYSLEVNPLTGKTKIRSEYLEVKPEDFHVEEPQQP